MSKPLIINLILITIIALVAGSNIQNGLMREAFGLILILWLLTIAAFRQFLIAKHKQLRK